MFVPNLGSTHEAPVPFALSGWYRQTYAMTEARKTSNTTTTICRPHRGLGAGGRP